MYKSITNFFHELCRDIFETVEDCVPPEELDALLAGASVRPVQLPLQPLHHLAVLSVPQMTPLIAVKKLQNKF